ncbi:MAG TPA: S-methyl-5'-thioadenosine phosphorylase [Euryarchaeota archaeon]|nr:S-methyl-5'-thioadenosine phosphorylase [archaeon BMS3Bbin15]HDL16116.1 S-methyl-5'-thioadenosine phosphorylase [Euryarchaeota archaeon]
MKVAIIGGSGVYDPKFFTEERVLNVSTPFGIVNNIIKGRFSGNEIYFLARHGKKHEIPPHKVNYRANIHALKHLGVDRIIAINSVGAVNPEFKPGSFIVPHDILDFTKRRASTFYDRKAVHIDMTEPYCPEIREAIIEADSRKDIFKKGVYAIMEGPRFETPAEIKMLSTLGADLVGMTGMPEASLARELEICYSAICISTNLGAGIKGEKLTATEVVDIVKKAEIKLREIIIGAIKLIPEKRNCPCSRALEGAEI